MVTRGGERLGRSVFLAGELVTRGGERLGRSVFLAGEQTPIHKGGIQCPQNFGAPYLSLYGMTPSTKLCMRIKLDEGKFIQDLPCSCPIVPGEIFFVT